MSWTSFCGLLEVCVVDLSLHVKCRVCVVDFTLRFVGSVCCCGPHFVCKIRAVLSHSSYRPRRVYFCKDEITINLGRPWDEYDV